MPHYLFTIPLYFLAGWLVSYLCRSFLRLPWYLTDKQFKGLFLSALIITEGWYFLRLLEIFNVNHYSPADGTLGMIKLAMWFLGYMLPLYFYRKKQLKNIEYIKTLHQKSSSIPGWELSEEVQENLP